MRTLRGLPADLSTDKPPTNERLAPTRRAFALPGLVARVLGQYYLRVDNLPRFDEDWSPVLKAIRDGDFFVTSGEVLIPEFEIAEGTVEAEIEWMYPLDFVEVVWGDGKTTDREIVSTVDKEPFGKKRFRIPFDRAGKKWVRLAAWDSAGNGAAAQPIHLR